MRLNEMNKTLTKSHSVCSPPPGAPFFGIWTQMFPWKYYLDLCLMVWPISRLSLNMEECLTIQVPMGENKWLTSRHEDYIMNLKETWTKKSQLFLWYTSLHDPRFIHRSVLEYLYRCQDYLYLYFIIKKREKQDTWGIILRCLNPLHERRGQKFNRHKLIFDMFKIDMSPPRSWDLQGESWYWSYQIMLT